MKSLVGFDNGKGVLGSYFHLGVFRGQSHSLGITSIFQAAYANKLLVFSTVQESYSITRQDIV